MRETRLKESILSLTSGQFSTFNKMVHPGWQNCSFGSKQLGKACGSLLLLKPISHMHTHYGEKFRKEEAAWGPLLCPPLPLLILHPSLKTFRSKIILVLYHYHHHLEYPTNRIRYCEMHSYLWKLRTFLLGFPLSLVLCQVSAKPSNLAKPSNPN